ncbi:hypothetical protein D3C72_1395210 [compost metagenome]
MACEREVPCLRQPVARHARCRPTYRCWDSMNWLVPDERGFLQQVTRQDVVAVLDSECLEFAQTVLG